MTMHPVLQRAFERGHALKIISGLNDPSAWQQLHKAAEQGGATL